MFNDVLSVVRHMFLETDLVVCLCLHTLCMYVIALFFVCVRYECYNSARQ